MTFMIQAERKVFPFYQLSPLLPPPHLMKSPKLLFDRRF